MTLGELVNNGLIWNKEIVVVMDDQDFIGPPIRIEFYFPDFEHHKLEWFESKIVHDEPVILLHVTKEE